MRYSSNKLFLNYYVRLYNYFKLYANGMFYAVRKQKKETFVIIVDEMKV